MVVRLNVIKEWYFPNVEDFVKKFRLQKEFRKEFKSSIKKWDYQICDLDVINHLLSKRKDLYFVDFLEKEDCLQVLKLNNKQPLILLKT